MAKMVFKGIRLSYIDEGEGEPALLFLPGWCASRAVFRPLVPFCRTHRRILALDWRGHGESGPSYGDFGVEDLLEDAMTVILASGARKVIPVALDQAGWIAIKLKQRMPRKISKLVFLNWLMTEAPPPITIFLRQLQSPILWRGAVENVLLEWIHGAKNAELIRYVRDEVGPCGFEMWSRAGREIQNSYASGSSPLAQLACLDPPIQTLHLYSSSFEPLFSAKYREFSASHPWFHTGELQAQSHFPMFEVPSAISAAIEEFILGEARSSLAAAASSSGKLAAAAATASG